MSTKARDAVRFDRVSSEDQKSGFSLDAQRSLGERYAKEHQLNVRKIWSVDESASKEDDRQEFFDMIDYIRANGIKDVIFDKVDRACRGFKAAVMIEGLISVESVRFHFTREHLIIDKDSPPQEKLRFSLGMVLGKYYIDNLKTEINKGLQARREVGLWNSKAPFGYKNIRVGDAEKAMVVPDENRAPLVRQMFELYATGNYPYTHFVDLVKAKEPERVVSKRLIEELLANPFYYGDMRVKGVVFKGSHEPLVDKKLWDSCQRIRGIRSANYRVMTGAIAKPLMNLLKCGECGHMVTGEVHTKASGKRYIYYHCAHPGCAQRRINTPQDDLFRQIGRAFEPFERFTPKATRMFIETLEGRLQDLDLYTQQATGELAQKRMEIKEKIAKLEQLHRDGVLTDSEHREVLAVKQAALDQVKVEIDAHNEADHKTFREGFRVIELLVKLSHFMKLDGNELEKARLAKLVLSNPILRDRTLRYSYEKPFDVLLDLTSNPIWWRRWESNPRPKAIRRQRLHV